MNLKLIKILISGIAFFLGLIFIKAGIEKLTGVPDIIGPPNIIQDLAKHDLELLGQFIAYSQIIIGFLLIHNRFRTIGAIMLLPMLFNILIVTISLDWQGTPLVVSFLIALNMILLVYDWQRIKFLFTDCEVEAIQHIKIKRTNYKIDLIYFLPLIIILVGTAYGWSDRGEYLVNLGLTILISLIVILKLRILVISIIHRKKASSKT